MPEISFIYVSRDKELAGQLDEALTQWNMATSHIVLRVGDNLMQSIRQGLIGGKYGIIILSKAFFKKPWSRFELDEVAQIDKDYEGETRLLPIWHDVLQQDISYYSQNLAGKIGLPSKMSLDEIVEEILEVVQPDAGIESLPAHPIYEKERLIPKQQIGTQMSDMGILHEQMGATFSDGDLRDLCFELKIDFDDLPGSGKRSKVRELILYMQRRGRLEELIVQLRRLRPYVEW